MRFPAAVLRSRASAHRSAAALRSWRQLRHSGHHHQWPSAAAGGSRLQSYHPTRDISTFRKRKRKAGLRVVPVVLGIAGLAIYSLYPSDDLRRLRTSSDQKSHGTARSHVNRQGPGRGSADDDSVSEEGHDQGKDEAWFNFARRVEGFSAVTDIEWRDLSDRLFGFIVPGWSKLVPGYVRKLQAELSMAPGSLADEIWQEAHDPLINPEIRYSANVRVSEDLCDEEKEFLRRRRKIVTVALAKYLGLDERDIHPDDIPIIAMCGSGGGLRALVAGTGSLLAASEDGLFDCVTYTSGVSGSCWLQSLLNSSLSGGRFDKVLEHIKARIAVHIAYPPAAFPILTSAPTNKYLLSGMVEKLKGDVNADIGLVDIYGILLAARLLVPRGELDINNGDFKLSNQRQYVKFGQNPLPIYTAVRHEIPPLDESNKTITRTSPSNAEKEKAKKEAWFQWFEVTPYEFFCEEFAAGIPTWALGRKFKNGRDVPPEDGFHLPEIRMPLLLGIFGSAFCATLSHYYHEIRPLVQSVSGFGAIDELIYGHNDDLSKVHPIDPARLPNLIYGMHGKLPKTTPETLYDSEYIQLMDAGMSNNLPIYPLLRPGRKVEMIIAFDASADIKKDNWLSVADGYARQRGIKGWPVGIGWPKPTDTTKQAVEQLEDAQAESKTEAEDKLKVAKLDQAAAIATSNNNHTPKNDSSKSKLPGAKEEDPSPSGGDLGYCTVWVGTQQERTSEPPPPSKSASAKASASDIGSWRLTEPDAGIAVVYLPFLANPAVAGVDPASSDYMSTWNFAYTPEQVDRVVALARANFAEGRAQIRAAVRAVYERKKRARETYEARRRLEHYRRLVRLGIAGRLGEGDHFS